MAEKKVAAEKTATEKKATTKKACGTKKASAKAELVINAENVGFKAGDVYQALAVAKEAMNVAEIAKAAKISKEEVLLGMGWLLKEGKVKDLDGKIILA